MRLASVLQNPYVKNTRLVLGHLSVGLGFSWLWLFVIELWRPGVIAGFINLNCLLAVAVVLWLVGERSLAKPYALGVSFAILIVVTTLAFIGQSPWLWWLPLVVLVGSAVAVRSFRTTT